MERKIKSNGFNVTQNDFFIHPNTLEVIQKTTDNICPSKYFINNNHELMFNKSDQQSCGNNILKDGTQKHMLYPYSILSSNYLYKIYNINSNDELFEKIKEMIEYEQKFATINRILNSCISDNYSVFKTKNDFLVEIYIYIFNHYYPKNKISTDELKKFINSWFENNSINNFNLNLGGEIIKNLV